MMDNEILQSFIWHFVELKDKINSVKTDISAVTAGQEELKTELKTDISAVTAGQEELKTDISAVTAGQEGLKSEISAVKNDIENSISAVKGEISAIKNELGQEISAFQERIRAGQAEFEERVTRNLREDLSRNIEVSQAEFEERVTCTVDTQLKNMSSVVEQQTRNLREDLSRKIEATRQYFETQLVALEARTKAAAWPTVRMREVTRVPTGRPPTPPERLRNERPLCWQCGKSIHFWRDCRQRPPGETGQDSRTRNLGRQSNPLATRLRC
jgi:gas vesicle protein